NLDGVGSQREFRRYYPAGPDCAQLVGFTDIDDHGQSGLELSFDAWLKPTHGKKRVVEDRGGRWVQDLEDVQIAKSGNDLKLSIDLRIQSLALRELSRALEDYKAKSATLVMIDIQTGEILAMISAPTFNPNKRQERVGPFTRNRAVTDQFEPGSTLKPFTVLMGLESGKFTPHTMIDTNPGYFFIGAHKVRDLHNYGSLSLTQILLKSSNVGVSRIALSVSSEQFIKSLTRFGFGQPILTGFPGESSGLMHEHVRLDQFSRAAMSFGYGLALTPLHLAWAYATIGAYGIKRPLTLQQIEKPETGQRIIAAETAATLLEMLAQVTERGTGRRAQIPGYRTAGKTGTIRVTEGGGYSEHRHIGLFAGITPVKNPRLATVVIIEEPQAGESYYGGISAAPVYARVVGGALHLLNVPPDNLPTNEPPKNQR
ncbi:MAG: penicillin-binding transpeptidase domain-containing protein, partial [Alphaproteobacteria bacterium]